LSEIAVALLAAGGVGVWTVTRPSSSDAAVPTLVSATTSTIRQSVSATGTLEPAHRADLSFVVSGTVTSVPVAVGDVVKVGTVLAKVDSAALQTAVTLAQANVTATQDQLTAQKNAGASAVQLASYRGTARLRTEQAHRCQDRPGSGLDDLTHCRDRRTGQHRHRRQGGERGLLQRPDRCDLHNLMGRPGQRRQRGPTPAEEGPASRDHTYRQHDQDLRHRSKPLVLLPLRHPAAAPASP